MRKFECSCKSRQFFVHAKDGMIQCFSCRKRYLFRNGAWEKFLVKKELKRSIQNLFTRKVFVSFQKTQESMGQWMKKHGVKKEKIVKRKDSNLVTIQGTAKVVERAKVLEEEHIRKKWHVQINHFKLAKFANLYGSFVIFEKNYYNGKLRGRDAARACHSDLKKIGVNTKISFKGNGAAELELRK